MNDYRAAIAGYIKAQARPVDKWSHQPRLYHLAVRIGAGMAFDDDVLYAAAWIHDLGVFIGHRPEEPEQLARWDNLAYVIGKAPGVLEQLGFPPQKIEAVIKAVETHLPDRTPTTVEGELLRDADILEQLGAVGILRTVSKVGRDTRFFTFSDALNALQRSLEKLPQRIRLPSAKALAEDRIRMLREFLQSAQTEADGQPL